MDLMWITCGSHVDLMWITCGSHVDQQGSVRLEMKNICDLFQVSFMGPILKVNQNL